MILYQDCSSHLDLSKNMTARGGAYFPYMADGKKVNTLTHSSLQTKTDSFANSDPLPRLLKPFGFVKIHGRQAAGLIFPIYLHVYRKLKKSSCQKPLDRFQYHFAEMFLWWSSTKIVQAIWICQKNMAARGRGLFSLYMYIYIENLKNLLVRNHWTDFHIIL